MRIRRVKSEEIVFRVLNENVVRRLRRDKKVKVPEKKIKIPKDMRWNEKVLASRLLRGILNGDSIQDISDSILKIVNNNIDSAIRNARTMTTSAECHGRLDSYHDLEQRGIVQKKVWIATADDRTRESHLEMDGEEVDIDEEFSNRCMFPGDEGCGDPSEVWNCRCSMRSHVIGFRREDGSISYVGRDRDDTLHDRQIDKERERREDDK